MTVKNELDELLDADVKSWHLYELGAENDGCVWFSEYSHIDGQSLSWDDLKRLNDEYGVSTVKSNSDGRTGSKLCVELEEIK